MTTASQCPECRNTLPADAPAGLCPTCLLKRGLGSAISGSTTNYGPFSPPSVNDLRTLFPQLEILELLGVGGMGAVYKARQPALDRFVAVKVLPQRDDPAFTERFTREARALAKLSHPGIVTVHDFGQAGGLYYFVMEYVEGVNLRQAERAGTLKPSQALAIVPQICAALQFAHDHGVVHRDIKPENILLDTKGRIKIADFGLAKLRGGDGRNPLTHTDQVMGTVHYMAPEQWEKPSVVDHRADIYSLGVVFYELLTGELPLGRFPLPSEKVQVDVRLDDIVLRTLEKQPERRYQHATDVKTDVEKLTAEAFDKLNLEEVKAKAATIKERQAELKATKKRLSERLGTLIQEDFRKKYAASIEKWQRRPRWQKAAWWTVFAAALALGGSGILVTAVEDSYGLSFANTNLVLVALLCLPMVTVPLAMATSANDRKAAAARGETYRSKPAGKIGCVIAAVQVVIIVFALGFSLISKDPNVKTIANVILLASVGWQLCSVTSGWLRSRLLKLGHATQATNVAPPSGNTDTPVDRAEPPGVAFKRALDVFVTPQPGFAKWVGVPWLLAAIISFLGWFVCTRSMNDKGAELTFFAVLLGQIIAGLALTINWAWWRQRKE